MSKRNRYERNIRLLYLEVGWAGPILGIISTYLSVYALRLGASTTLVSLLFALPGLINVILPLPLSHLVEQQRGKKYLIAPIFLYRLGFLFMALVPWVLPTYQAEAIVIINSLIAVPLAFIMVSFTTIYAGIVRLRDRAHVTSNRNLIMGVVSTATVFIGGKILELLTFPLNYQVLFLIGFVTSLVGTWLLARIDVSEIAEKKAGTAERSKPEPFWTIFSEMTRNRHMFYFMSGVLLFYWGLFMAIALFPIYLVRYVNASDWWISIIGAISGIGITGGLVSAISNPGWGRLASKRGNRFVLLVSTMGMVPQTLLFAVIRQVEVLFPVTIVFGIFAAGMNMSLYNAMLEVLPEENRARYIAAYSSVMNLAIFLAPIVGALVAEQISLTVAFIVAAALRLIGSLIFLRMEKKEAPVLQPAGEPA